MKLLLSFIFIAFVSSGTYAGEADVVFAKARCRDNICSFSVTLKHADEGWDHYANQWDVLSMKGEVLGTRILLHPHVHEQPFTRSLSNVKIPSGTEQVLIRARDSKHGTGGEDYIVDIKWP